MADTNAGASFDEIIQEGRRKKAAEKLAQEIFGKKGRSSAPPSGPKAGLGGSLASRVGVVKRNSPSPRATAPRAPAPRAPPRQQLHTRPPADEARNRPRLSHTQSSAPDLGSSGRSNGNTRDDTNGGPELSIKGVASGPYIVYAQNFASGTTAADIEQVMLGVGGAMNYCKLVASQPTVIAEMSFVERSGAEKVIETFNGKKADGRPLYVYMKNSRNAPAKSTPTPNQPTRSQSTSNINEVEDVSMEVDENAESREAENRRREEHRSRDRDDRASRDVFPTGPRGYRAEMDRYDYRRPEPGYQDGRYGSAGGRGGGGFRDGPRGGYSGYGSGRRYGGNAQSWRP